MTRSLGPVLVFVVVLAAIAPVSGVAAAQEETPTPSGNETQHVDPDETNQNGDLGGVQSALARRMAERLAGSSIALSQGQYELADQLVGEEYQEQYGKYVDVAGETDEEQRVETFDTARDRQERFNRDVQQYDQKVREYRQAKRNGNETRARRLARELDRLASNVSRERTPLVRTYQTLGNATGVETSNATVAVNRTVENVTETQAEIRQAEFVATTLTVEPRSERAAFDDPLVLDGELLMDNGTAVANRTIALGIDDQRLTTRTNASGEFTVSYRPVTIRVGAAEEVVRYVPDPTSPYLGARANTTFTVDQVESTVEIKSATDTAGFGDEVMVTGTVTAAGQPVPALPVVLVVDGKRLANVTTNEAGEYALRGRLPARISTGEKELRVLVPLEDRAVRGASASRSIQVTETGTTLRLETEPTASSISLSGRLQTDAGAGVAGQELEIRRNGSVVATARTNPDGVYTVTVPASADTRYRVEVRYDDSTTNLGNASATAAVSVPPAGPGGDGEPGSSPGLVAWVSNNPAAVVGGAVLLLLGVVAAVWWWLRREDSEAGPAPQKPSGPVTGGTIEATADPLAPAEAAIDEDANAAIERAYRTIRNRLRTDGIGSDDATHWEFYRACVDSDVENLEALETLTTLYERAAFDSHEASRADAETALDRAAQF